MLSEQWRRTTQDLMPAEHTPRQDGYDIYGAYPVAGTIDRGYTALARRLRDAQHVVIDGYGGVFWDICANNSTPRYAPKVVEATWVDARTAMLDEDTIGALIEPFLGGDDPIFGTRYTGELAAFFDPTRLAALQPPTTPGLAILYGTGAALAGWDGPLVYLDVPKNEIQFRARAGAITNLGASAPTDPKRMYKRFYFVDWVALNRHKAALLPRIDIIVDAQRPDDPTSMSGDDLRSALGEMSQNWFRVRPWFEPGPWGGQWIKEHIPQLPRDVPNYAWSFELIVPENGLLFGHDGMLLETSFDMLMFHDHHAVIGASAERFGYEFPIRFDFLDTFDGGNLSVQCHPRPEYIQEHFGETFTQDETYYILDCEPGAEVYLGFREDTDPTAFRQALEDSFHHATPIDIKQWVNIEPAQKHDLFLIPNGTIHCSGINNLVLEISATPYIFTFKMYDWMRLDLDGRPRPLNIARACENLYWDRRGSTHPRGIRIASSSDRSRR